MVEVETVAVRKRFGDEWTDVRHFVRPDDFMVADLVASRPEWTPRSMWEWVVQNIRYPSGDFLSQDWHALMAFRFPVLPVPRLLYQTVDFWEFPAETLRDRRADCEGSAALLVSMLRRAFPDLESYVSVGYFKGFGHVWASLPDGDDWLILDTTLERVPEVVPRESEAPEYEVLFRFSHQRVAQVAPDLVVPERVHEVGKDNHLRGWYQLIESSRRG